ncbi:MAG: hypothetical protein HY334_01700 [Armatimonadetes bacterium]|nr:hypothetical protein [Armatimonadota bacterium]
MTLLDRFQRELERLETDLNRETYRQYAGLPYDESLMEQRSREMETLVRGVLEEVPAADFPRPLLYASVRASRASEYTRLDNEIYRLRGDAVSVEDEGETVNLNNWRLFNRAHVRAPQRRRRVFDALLDRALVLTPLLAERFALSRDLFGRYNMTPLDAYLEEEEVDFSSLWQLVDSTARAARPAFREALAGFSAELLGQPPDYYDDYYVFGNVIYEPVDRHFAGVDFAALVGPIYEGLGFDLSQIAVDGEPRERKHASPICFAVRVPDEVYVLYQQTSPVYDYTGYCHEMGHALHFASVNRALPYMDRYLVPAGVAEIFSLLFETLGTTPRFLAEEVGLPQAAIDDLRRRERLMDLYFLTFYGANAMFNLRYWTEHPDMDAADALYADLYARYVGLEMPGRYWQTHHVVALYDVYAPSYLLAKVRTAELRRLLEERFTERWWRNPAAGAYLREELMGPGRGIPVDTFSRLDPRPSLVSLGL